MAASTVPKRKTAAATPPVRGIKTFSATLARERGELGDVASQWMRANEVTPLEVIVLQSSDSEYHCLTITILF